MFSIHYLEPKKLTRLAFQLLIEKQAECKIVYSGDCIKNYETYLVQMNTVSDLCIISDSFPYIEIIKLIKLIKQKSNHPFILLKSDMKLIKSICFLLKNGLDGIFFTEDDLIDLKHCVRNKTKFKLSANKLKLISTNRMNEFHIKELHYNTSPLTLNELQFIQACAKDESYEQIAYTLGKSINTIFGYRDRIFKKLQVKQRSAMVLTALKRNYIDL